MLKQLRRDAAVHSKSTPAKSPDRLDSRKFGHENALPLEMKGDHGRRPRGNRNIWAISEEFSEKSGEEGDTEEELERLTEEQPGLGTASAREINYYFPRGRYQN